ncbi:MAG TPA: hypothetical protein GXZ65_04220 [Clostridiales bacterium]|nr:hypothetical protein [Clostridiales bacterium]
MRSLHKKQHREYYETFLIPAFKVHEKQDGEQEQVAYVDSFREKAKKRRERVMFTEE